MSALTLFLPDATVQQAVVELQGLFLRGFFGEYE